MLYVGFALKYPSGYTSKQLCADNALMGRGGRVVFASEAEAMKLIDVQNWLRYGKDRKAPVFQVRLNVPGHSTREEFERRLFNGGVHLLSIVFAMIILLWSMGLGPSYLIVVGIAALILRGPAKKSLQEIRNYRLGWHCEAIIGQQLETCRSLGYSVFHDVEYEANGRKFNVDHLLIGPAGVIVVETKGRTKPARGKTEVRLHGGWLHFTGRPPENKPIDQINAAASHVEQDIRRLMREHSLNYPFPPIIKVLAIPGWFVEERMNDDIILTMENEMITTLIGKLSAKQGLSDQAAKELSASYQKALEERSRRL